MKYNPRIFISCIYKLEKDSPQKRIKNEIINQIKNAGFEPQIFLEEGLAEDMAWNFDSVYGLLKRCDGAVILGCSRCLMQDKGNKLSYFYNQFETDSNWW